jgi:hypothetical protein
MQNKNMQNKNMEYKNMENKNIIYLEYKNFEMFFGIN